MGLSWQHGPPCAKDLGAGPFAADVASFRLHLAAENKAPGTIRTYTEVALWFAAAHLLHETPGPRLPGPPLAVGSVPHKPHSPGPLGVPHKNPTDKVPTETPQVRIRRVHPNKSPTDKTALPGTIRHRC